MEALAPFRAPLARPADDLHPLPYMNTAQDRAQGGARHRTRSLAADRGDARVGESAVRLTRSKASEGAYWTPAQGGRAPHLRRLQPAAGRPVRLRHAVGAEPPTRRVRLLELTQGGKQPITLPNGETRSFLADGDTLTLRGFCERSGARRVGFGACSATVLHAPAART